MTIIAAPRSQNTCLARRSTTGHGGAHSHPQLGPQLDRSSSFKVDHFDRSEPLIQRYNVEQCAGSSRRLSNAAAAALKSP
jgi:hypothetical protein